MSTARNFSIVQNFRLIWLDVNDEKLVEGFEEVLSALKRIVDTIDTFTDIDQCIDFLTDVKDERTFLIVSDPVSPWFMSVINDVIQLDSIYIYSINKSYNQQWISKWSKLKGVFTQTNDICELLKKNIEKCELNSVSISALSSTEISKSNLNEIDQSFMYSQLFKEILLEIDNENDKDQSREDFIDYCRNRFSENTSEINFIKDFEINYRNHMPIWWYTRPCFLYAMLNRALRILEIDTLLKMRFFICDLHRNIQEIYSVQSRNFQKQTFTVYRGQGLTEHDFQKLIEMKGGLMSFNNFLSTSLDRDISYLFAESNSTDPNLIGVLFKIIVDTSISTTPFVQLDKLSYYQESEQEILFSTHTIFRMGQMEQIYKNNSRLWQINLTLTADKDPQLDILTKWMREETLEGIDGWYRMGELLFRLGQLEKAEDIYRSILQRKELREFWKGHLYTQLARIKDDQGNYQQSIVFYQLATEIFEKISANKADLISIYNNAGKVYEQLGDYHQALSLHLKAIELHKTSSTPNQRNLSLSYMNIGRLYRSIGQHSNALSYLEQACNIAEKLYPSNHPDLAMIYNCIASVYWSMGNYSKAILFLEKDLHIQTKILPPNHSYLGISYNHISVLYRNLGENSTALFYAEKAIEIHQKCPFRNELMLACDYHTIAGVYHDLADYSKALSFYQKAFQIKQEIFPSNHPDISILYNNLGGVYAAMGNYERAISLYEKSIEISLNIGSSDHSTLALVYNNIGIAYENLKQYLKALSFYEKAITIQEKVLCSNHPHLAHSYQNISKIYIRMGLYSKALSFCEKSMMIKQKSLSPNHPSLASSYSTIGCIYHYMGQYLKALSFYQSALEIAQRSLSPDHPDLQRIEENIEKAMKKI